MNQRIGYFMLLFFIFVSQFLYAQLSPPQVEEVYGGRIHWIDAASISPTTTRVYISTESANSLFYTHVDHSVTPAKIDTFTAVPDVDSDDNFGSNLGDFSVDEVSGRVFFVNIGHLYSASTTAGSLNILENAGVLSVKCYKGWLFYLKDQMGNLELHFGTIDSASGNFVEDANSPLTVTSGIPPGGPVSLAVNPANDSLYIFQAGTPPMIYCSSNSFQHLS
ncbi:MAG: hypothetical protein D6748_13600, partial [Calditrichaeota bacterium]